MVLFLLAMMGQRCIRNRGVNEAFGSLHSSKRYLKHERDRKGENYV